MSDGTLFVTGENHLTALDTADGSLAWEREFEIDESIPDPTVAFDTVYLVVDEILYAFDADDGSVRWEKEMIDARPIRSEAGDPEPASFRPETVAVANGTVYAALAGPTYDEQDSGRAFGAVDATTGDERWGIGFSPHDDEDNVITEPIVATGQYVYADDNISLNGVRFDVETGDATGNEYAVWAGTDSVRIDTDGSERWVLEFDDYLPDITAYDRPAVTAVDEDTLYIDTGEELVAMRRFDDADERDDEPEDEDEKSDQDDDQQGDEDVDAGDDEDESGCPDDDPTDE
ncbi:outer membrane protein assembly factor BamB family protein [Natronococcus zhouii]|uniref:outer membrane protein assembly factor BamB family protein n=1 Tax=Natronococcus zhouii TaxID=2951804 RepID=UPI00207CF5A5|nr:PQQ-binding-like beta-propeller repeat protein [Natronococcus sp. CG52]